MTVDTVSGTQQQEQIGGSTQQSGVELSHSKCLLCLVMETSETFGLAPKSLGG